MPDYTTLGISFPVPSDTIKLASLEAKLADDIRLTAITANQAIITEGGRAEAAAKAAAAADASAKDAAIDAKANSAVSTANNALAASSGASSDADNAVDRVTALESAAGFGPSTPTDGTMADYIANPATLTASQLSTRIAERTSAVVTDHGFATVQLALDAAQPGDTVEIRRAWTISAPVTVSKQLNIRCARGGSVTTSGDVHAFNVTASYVTFERATIAGSGGSTLGTQSAIRAIGTALAPIRGLEVQNCKITGFRMYGVEGEHLHDFTIERNRVEDIGYAGVMLLSPNNGDFRHNTVRKINQPAGLVNSYGISASRRTTQNLTDAPLAKDMRIYQNLVDGVPKWEGIDTHGGIGIHIISNIVRNCNVGIALVPEDNEAGVEVYAPKRCKVLTNNISSGVTNGTRSIGIQLVGCITTISNVVDYADAVIQGNTVDGHGKQDDATSGAIYVAATIGSIIDGNIITEAGLNAIHAGHNNKGLKVNGNTAVDTWSNALAYTSMLRVSSDHNTIKFSGNDIVRANKTATTVNNRGLYVSSGLTGVAIQWGDNDMSGAALPKVDGGLSFSRMGGTNLAFTDTGTPVLRPTLAGVATDQLTTQALVNQLRTALINYGLAT